MRTEAKILAPEVPGWSAGGSFRSTFEQALGRRLGDSAMAELRSHLDGLPPGRLAAAWSRLPYVDDVADLFDPDWRLEVELVPVGALLRHAFKEPLPAGLLLELAGARLPDHLVIFSAVPWLGHLDLGEAHRIVQHLLEQGWVVVSCTGAAQASRLGSAIRSKRVRVTVLGPPPPCGGSGPGRRSFPAP